MQWSVVLASMPYLLQGVRATLILSVTVLVTGTALGAVWGMLRRSPLLHLRRGRHLMGLRTAEGRDK